MKKLFYCSVLIIIVLIYCSCRNQEKSFKNKEFELALANYIEYVDSVQYKPSFDYILIDASGYADSTVFSIYLCGGSYVFLKSPEKVADFFSYKGYDVLLLGCFPNEVIPMEKNKNLNIVRDVVRKRYPGDYKKYLNDKYSVGPLIYDEMNMILVFKRTKLISCNRYYY